MADGFVKIRSVGTHMWCGLDSKTHTVVCAEKDEKRAGVFRMRQTGEEHATVMYQPGTPEDGNEPWGCEVDKQTKQLVCHPNVRWENNQSSMFRFELYDETKKAYSFCWGPRLDQATRDADCVAHPGQKFTDVWQDTTTVLACKSNILPRHLDICSVTANRLGCTHHTSRHRPVTGLGYTTMQRANHTALFEVKPIQ